MSVIRLTGVLDDGTNFEPGVPTNTARRIQFAVGESVTLIVSLINNAGIPVPSTDPTGRIVFSMDQRLTPGFSVPMLTKTATLQAGTPADYQILIVPNDTRLFEAGRWLYDIWFEPVVPVVTREQVVRLSDLLLSPTMVAP